MAIGINEYSNKAFQLRYAVADADDLAAEFTRKQEGLRQFSAVRPVILRDGAATKANIRLALSRLAGESKGPLPAGAAPELLRLEAVKPEDTLVVYFAGHGVASGDRFYMIPHDMGFAGPQEEVAANLPRILQQGISDQDLERALEPMVTRHMMLIIDACYSGQALASDEDRRGPMNSRGLAQLAWEKGISVLTASQAYQAALESKDRGHGFLTYALVQEGLQTPVADGTPGDGLIQSTEWLEYAVRRVPQLHLEALEKAKLERAKRELRLERPRDAGLQAPRLFTRRDAPEKPLTVAAFPQ